MGEMKLISWNINGIRSAVRHGFMDWLKKESPDVLCLQETKAAPADLPDSILKPEGYFTFWNIQRRGYAGVATFTKKKPLRVLTGFGVPEFDIEGRVLISEHPGFTVFNIYFPNGKQGPERLKFKMDFYDAFLDFIEPLRLQGKKLIICGDINTAHKEIDIARPKANSKVSGFLPEERAWMDKFVSRGYVDTFRYFNKEPDHYSYWDIKTGARARNVGWRIDYFYVTENMIKQVKKSVMLPEVMGSDHCPIMLILQV
jgi:exodeoxyribonuclease-3